MNHYYSVKKSFVLFFLSLVLTSTTFAGTFTVTSTADAGAGTLRQAITDANAVAGPHNIIFAIAGGGPHTISLLSPLPAIVQQISIDGYSQGTQGTISGRTILININGAGAGVNAIGFNVNFNNVTISGLAIYSFSSDGIYINPAVQSTFVWGCYIGTDNTGTVDLGNAGHGINFNDFAPGVSGGPGGSSLAVIGTNGDGTNDANEGNLLSGNTLDGIGGWALSSSIIAGNIIGLDKNGTAAIGNSRNGILLAVNSLSNRIGTDGNGTSDALEGNIISRNGTVATDRGILLAANSNLNIIAGNVIGLDAANAAAGNTGMGIEFLNSSNNRVGVDVSHANFGAERNTISSNVIGIYFTTVAFFGLDFPSSGNIIAGNYIGTTSGALVRGNSGNAIEFFANNAPYTISNNIIGSNGDGTSDDQEANVISNNAQGFVTNNSTLIGSNRLSRNIFSNNAQLAIDLSNDGVTSNDDGDIDTGPNELYNFPVITSVIVNGSNNLVITGFSRPGSVIEFYIADAGPNPNPLPGGYTTSFGEGATYLFRGLEGGTLDGVTDADATAGTYTGTDEGTGLGGTRTENRFSFTIAVASLPAAVANGTRITSIALSAAAGAANTSEFGGVASVVLTPVTFISFTAKLDNGKTYLQWVTASETNNRLFEVERSSDGVTYSSIGTVQGRGGRNTRYDFVDDNPSTRINYYRLRQVDLDGKFMYSRTLIIRSDLGKLEVKITPNPVISNINISFRLDRAEVVRIQFYDQMGRVARRYSVEGSKGVNALNLTDLSNLLPGTYVVEVSGENFSAKQYILKR